MNVFPLKYTYNDDDVDDDGSFQPKTNLITIG